MNTLSVMQEIATQLGTIDGLRVHIAAPGTVTPPAAVVAYPTQIDYDGTYGRGMDTMTVPVVVMIGRPTDRATVELLSAYCDGSGAKSVKAVLQAGTYTAFDGLRVRGAEFDALSMAGTEYMTALFELDIWGQGEV